jgi:hypothetical protein
MIFTPGKVISLFQVSGAPGSSPGPISPRVSVVSAWARGPGRPRGQDEAGRGGNSGEPVCVLVRRQASVTLLGRIQSRDLPGQVVIAGSRCELVEAHRQTHTRAGTCCRCGHFGPGGSDGAPGVWAMTLT